VGGHDAFGIGGSADVLGKVSREILEGWERGIVLMRRELWVYWTAGSEGEGGLRDCVS